MTSRNSWTRLIALSLTVVALAIPSIASAAPVDALGTYHATGQNSESSSPSVTSSDSGFDWGDAAIGAAAVVAITVIGAGAAMLVRSSRDIHHRFRVTS